MQDAVRLMLMYAIVPLWVLAGLGDWWCHRRAGIERNAGIFESAMHSLMMIEVGVPVLLALFLEINALQFAIMLIAIAVHAVTAWVDVAYASTRREIRPVEQHMHSLLEVLPLTAVTLVASAYWPQVLALFGMGCVDPDFSFRLKENPLPSSYVSSLIIGLILFVAAPYMEELIRCARASHMRRRASGR